MEMIPLSIFICLLATSVYLVHGSHSKHYIVYMGEHCYPDSDTVIAANHEMLSQYFPSVEESHGAVVHHYTKSFGGFSALLTPDQADHLSKNETVVSVFESKIHTLHTTRSWDFMDRFRSDQPKGLFKHMKQNQQQDVIVGHFDSGVWPESPSFNPSGLGPVPEHFRGRCDTGDQFTKHNCNRKLIGARFYYKGYEKDGPIEDYGPVYRSPRDDFGHGSHTASTAVGAEVRNIKIAGFGKHTAQGGAPSAQLSVYKCCWNNRCSCSDMLKAFDDSIHDRVDIITMSIGSLDIFTNYLGECISLGSLHAFRNGILVSTSAGNEGGYRTIVNTAPWVMTVAASTIDREIYTAVALGNGETLKGYGFNLHSSQGSQYIIRARDAAIDDNKLQASFCNLGSLNPYQINGKIVVCETENYLEDDAVAKSNAVLATGGVGMILVFRRDGYGAHQGQYEIGYFAVPSTLLTGAESRKLLRYLEIERYPYGRILPSKEEFGMKPAPKLAYLSSKGPSLASPEVIKPDVTAPGLNILAAFPSNGGEDHDKAFYGFDSGTSMACPHVSGVAAVIKSHHYDWSPAAIKSAIMTTASPFDNIGGSTKTDKSIEATPVEVGSGHIVPNRAMDPGLVYDFNINDVIDFLCSHGATSRQLKLAFGKKETCKQPLVAPHNLNYPSIGIEYMEGKKISVFRTLTFKGQKDDPYKIYRASISMPEGVKVEVVPHKLDFRNATEASFRVDIYHAIKGKYVHGRLTWSDGHNRQVTIPIALNLRYV